MSAYWTPAEAAANEQTSMGRPVELLDSHRLAEGVLVIVYRYTSDVLPHADDKRMVTYRTATFIDGSAHAAYGTIVRTEWIDNDPDAASEADALLARVAEYAEANPGTDARLARGGRVHTGYLTVTRTVRDGDTSILSVRVRDSRKGARSQYATVNRRTLADLQIKVGARYVPAAEVIA
jgi:hypothetical protein